VNVPTMDINEIMQHVPHRYPFLLVDRVLECEAGQRIKAVKNVTINEPYFQGHFPGYPVMPGVLIIEALAQVSAILAYITRGERPNAKSLLFFAGIDQARFKRPVFPGDQLVLESVELNVVRSVFKFAAKASVGSELVAEAQLMAAVRRDAQG
jgi:3-hydroxyacyl-[acyl-carrier-protein] dehydratase